MKSNGPSHEELMGYNEQNFVADTYEEPANEELVQKPSQKPQKPQKAVKKPTQTPNGEQDQSIDYGFLE